jgi:hypothetical protein
MITMIDGNHWRALTERFAALDDYKSTNIANNFYQLYLTLLNHSCDAAHPTLSPKECP